MIEVFPKRLNEFTHGMDSYPIEYNPRSIFRWLNKILSIELTNDGCVSLNIIKNELLPILRRLCLESQEYLRNVFDNNFVFEEFTEPNTRKWFFDILPKLKNFSYTPLPDNLYLLDDYDIVVREEDGHLLCMGDYMRVSGRIMPSSRHHTGKYSKICQELMIRLDPSIRH